MERIKVWSILMLIMIIPLRSSAQVYTELDLIGKWTLTETTDDANFLAGFDFIIILYYNFYLHKTKFMCYLCNPIRDTPTVFYERGASAKTNTKKHP